MMMSGDEELLDKGDSLIWTDLLSLVVYVVVYALSRKCRQDTTILMNSDMQGELTMDRQSKGNPYVALARSAVEARVRDGRILPVPEDVPEEMLNRRAGAFVTIYRNGRLRGCIGTIHPTRASLAEEIISNAIASSTQDPRFPAVSPPELMDLEISVDVLGDPEPITSLDELDPVRYGVIVSCGYRRGLLLPNLEGVDTAKEQVDIARRKAGIDRHENYTLERFEVIRHKDD